MGGAFDVLFAVAEARVVVVVPGAVAEARAAVVALATVASAVAAVVAPVAVALAVAAQGNSAVHSLCRT